MSIGSFLKKVSGYDALKKLAGRDKRYLEKGWARDDTRIQRTVADARAAGVHPLFALGGATGGSSTLTAPDTGSQIGQAFKYLQGRQDRSKGIAKSTLVDTALIKQANANAELAEARKNTETWQLQNSINKRLEGNANVQQDTIEPEAVRKHPSENNFVGPMRPRLTILEDGSIIKMDPRTSTGQELEDTHGEVMGNVYGIYNEIVRGLKGTANRYSKGYEKFMETWPVKARKRKTRKRYYYQESP